MFVHQLIEIEDALRAITVALDPDTVAGTDAQAAMERFARIEKMAHAGARLMGKRVADTGVWKNRGHQSPAHAVADALGCSTGDAQRELGTAAKLAKGLDATDRAARRGELSPTQTGHVADAASVDPNAERDLLDLAGSASTAELREEARRRRHAAARDDAERHRRIRRNRSMRMWSDDDGGARLAWSHLPELGAEVGAILDPYIDEQFHAARKAGLRERREAYAADAFVDALRDAAAFRRGESIDDEPDDPDGSVVDHPTDVTDAADNAGAPAADAVASPDSDASGPAPTDAPGTERTGDATVRRTEAGDDWVAPPAEPGERAPIERPERPAGGPTPPAAVDAPLSPRPTDDDPPGDGGGRRRRRRARPRRRGADAKVIVRIDHTALVRGHTEAGELCEIAGVGPVPVASVVELMDDAFLAAVVTKGVDILNVAHLGRRPNAFQTTALQANPTQCTTLGCPNRARLENDHRDPFCDTLETSLANLDPSCFHCHDLKTYEGHRHEPGSGPRRLLSPAEQVEWNREHPDEPIAPFVPPGRRGPRFRSARSAPPAGSWAPSTPSAPDPEPLTLDL